MQLVRRTSLALAALGLAWTLVAGRPLDKPAEEAARVNNLGVAYMNQQRFDKALELFQQAYRLYPELQAARLNQGIALFNQRRYEDARVILLEMVQRVPTHIRAWYNLGLLYKTTGQPEAALEAFERVAQLDPDSADVHYFRGLLLTQLGRYESAIAAYQRALELNPFHASAEFGLARAYLRRGESPRARKHFARFQYLKQEKLGAPLSLAYGDQGQYSLAEQVELAAAPVPPAIPVRFQSASQEAGLDARENKETPHLQPAPLKETPSPLLGPGACFFDYDADGLVDLYVVNSGTEPGALYHNSGKGRFEEVTTEAEIKGGSGGLACTAGDYDNDGRIDLALSFLDGVRLYRNQGDGTFRNVTDSTLAAKKREENPRGKSFPLGLTFVDYDHDGDLDLYVSYFRQATPSPEQGVTLNPPGELSHLWRNNGNGTFTDWTAATGLGGTGPQVAAVGTDFNNDRAIDLVVTGWRKAAVIFVNPREGRFQPVEPWSTAMPAPTAGVVSFDFNKDGWMDLAFTHWGAPGVSLWRNDEGRRFEPVPLPGEEWMHGWGITVLDYDNDGWLDLAAVGEREGRSAIRLLRNRGPEGFEEVTATVGLAGVKWEKPRALLTADYDGDGDTDLLVTQNGGPVQLLRNQGGNRNNWLRVALKGLADNKSAIGTRVEVFAGALWQRWEVQAASGYLGQSELAITAGLGRAPDAEIVRLLWPTGVLQDEVQLPSRAAHAVNEIDRRGSSCPILFAWNGARYEFIADVIGAGIVGHWVAPGERNVSDPDEYIRVEGARVQPRRGRLSFRFAEPMEEIIYLDQARLLAIDHPAEVEVYPNEYFAGSPPFPPFKTIVSRGARLPRGAWDQRGRNVLPELSHRDHRYVTGFAPLPFKGFADQHWLELDLGPWQESQPLRLLLHGFIDYFSATSVFAAHQAGLEPMAPYIEALDAKGRWVRVVENMGFPAGLPRTMVADLTERLPARTRRIRLVTNLQIYWDQILIDTSPNSSHLRLTEVPLAEARLVFHGYPRAVEGNPPGDLTYIYEEVSAIGPYARHTGSYTRYGDVRPLLMEADDRFVIFGSGEEVRLEFDPVALPPLPAGWRRDYFFYANGFAKDMDFYEAHSQTVEPLPFHGMGRYPYPPPKSYPEGEPYLAYQLNYNSRHVSGKAVSAFRFDYRREEKQ